MRGAIAPGTVKGASCRAQPVRAPSTVKRCPTQPSPRALLLFLLCMNHKFCFSGEASKDRIKYVCHSNVERKRGLYERKMPVR